MPRIFVILPAYNEEQSLPPLFESFEKLLSSKDGKAHSWRLIAVNDGSSDATARVLEQWSARLPIEAVHHAQNRGLGEAILTGFRTAMKDARDKDVLVCLDADDTHPPETIPSMIEMMGREKAELVIASRYQPGSRQVGVPWNRRLLSSGAGIVFRLFLQLPGVKDYTCGFRAYQASLIRRAFEHFGDGLITRRGFACTDELLVHLAILGPRIREAPFILRYDRKKGASKLKLGLTIIETLRLLWGHRKELKKHSAPKREI